MTQPTPYVKSQTFADIQSGNTLVPIPGQDFDVEFSLVQITLAQVLTNLARIQRDDTALANASVGVDQLKPEIVLLLNGVNPRGTWLTATAFAKGDVVTQASKIYVALIAHTSGVFATDLAANKWMSLSPFTGASSITNTPAGGISATDVQSAINELDAEKQPLDATLTALAGVVTAADKMIYATALDVFATTTVTAAARTVLDDTTTGNMLVTLGAVAKAGDTMTGDLVLRADPTTALMASTKQYVDNKATSGVGFKNRIINGDFYMDQRNGGASKTITAGAGIAYTVDRWYAQCTGANVTVQQVAGTLPQQYAVQFTGLAANTLTRFGTRIEGDTLYDLTSTQVTCSVGIKSNALASVTWKAYTADVKDTFSAKTQIDSGTLTISTTTTTYSFTFAAGLNAGRGIAIEFETGPLLGTQTLTYQGVQLETGSSPTAFEVISIDDRRKRAYRFCRRRSPAAASKLSLPGFGYTNNTTQYWADRFDVEMRASPVFSISAAADFILLANNTTLAATSLIASVVDQWGAALQTSNGSYAVNVPGFLQTTGVSGWMQYDAEL